MNLTASEVRTILVVFKELKKKPYGELHSYFGRITLDEIDALYKKLNKWYDADNLAAHV